MGAFKHPSGRIRLAGRHHWHRFHRQCEQCAQTTAPLSQAPPPKQTARQPIDSVCYEIHQQDNCMKNDIIVHFIESVLLRRRLLFGPWQTVRVEMPINYSVGVLVRARVGGSGQTEKRPAMAIIRKPPSQAKQVLISSLNNLFVFR